MRPEFDARDQERLNKLEAEYNQARGPRVGDYVQFPGEQELGLRRFTHDWGERIQTTCKPKGPFACDQRFFFGGEYVSFSGSLDPAIDKGRLEATDEIRAGWFWFFHHNDYKADNGVSFEIPVRVWKVKGA